MQTAGALLGWWISKRGFSPYQVGLGWSDAPDAPSAPDISNPPVLLWLTVSPTLWRAESTLPNHGSFGLCRWRPCYPAGWAIASKAKILVSRSHCWVQRWRMMTMNQINCALSFVSNHSVQGSLAQGFGLHIKQIQMTLGRWRYCFMFGFHFKLKTNGKAKSGGLKQMWTHDCLHEEKESLLRKKKFCEVTSQG